MEHRPGTGGKANRRSRIAGDTRFKESNMQHRAIVPPLCLADVGGILMLEHMFD